MHKVVRLRTRKETAESAVLAEAARVLRQLSHDQLGELLGLNSLATYRASSSLYHHAHPEKPGAGWPGGFTMLSRNQTQAVWNAIRQLPAKDRPVQVRDAFVLLMLNIRQDTGECTLTREEIAAHIGCRPNHVSGIMSTLERMGVLRRDLTRVEGMRGRGVVTYVVNADVAWNGSLERREQVADKFGKAQLQLVPTGPTEPPGPAEPASSPEPDPAPAPQPRRGRGRRPAPAGEAVPALGSTASAVDGGDAPRPDPSRAARSGVKVKGGAASRRDRSHAQGPTGPEHGEDPPLDRNEHRAIEGPSSRLRGGK